MTYLFNFELDFEKSGTIFSYLDNIGNYFD